MDQLLTKVEFKVVCWDDAWAMARSLMELHCKDFGIPDLEQYIGSIDEIYSLERVGNLVLDLALGPEFPVGYVMWKIGWHQGLRANAASMGPWFVLPGWRKNGVAMKLLRHSWQSLKYRGCRWALVTLPVKHKRKTPFGILYEQNYIHDLFKPELG